MTEGPDLHALDPGDPHARDYFSHIRHELKTPVNAVIGYSELLLEDAQDQGQAGFIPDLRRIQIAGRTLLTLINELLVVENAGAVVPIWEPVASAAPLNATSASPSRSKWMAAIIVATPVAQAAGQLRTGPCVRNVAAR